MILCKEFIKASDEPIFMRRVESSGKLMQGRMISSEMTGFPDLLIISDSRAYCAELKMPGKYMTEKQAKTISELIEKGRCTAGVVTSLFGFIQFINDKPADDAVKTDYGEIPVWN